MWYLIRGEDKEDSLELRRETQEVHLARLRELQQQGRLLLAGLCPRIESADPGAAGYRGSLIIADFGSLDEAQDWVRIDPCFSAGVCAQVIVQPFTQISPYE